MKKHILILFFAFLYFNASCQDSTNTTKSLTAKDSLMFHLPRVNLFLEVGGLGRYFSFNTEFRLFKIKNNAFSLRIGFMNNYPSSSGGMILNYNRMINKNINFEGGLGLSSYVITNGYTLSESEYEEKIYSNILLNLGINYFVSRNLLFKINIYPAYTQYYNEFKDLSLNKTTIINKKYPNIFFGGSIGYSFRKRIKNIAHHNSNEKHKKEINLKRLNSVNYRNNLSFNLLGTSIFALNYERVLYKKNKNSFSGEFSFSLASFFTQAPGFSFPLYYKRDIYKFSQLESGFFISSDAESNQSIGLLLGYRYNIGDHLATSFRLTYIYNIYFDSSIPMAGVNLGYGF